MEDKHIAVFAGIFLLIAIGLFLITPMSNADRTLILTTPSTSNSSETTQCINLGTQFTIIKNSTSGNCYVYSIAGEGLTISKNSTHIIITNEQTGETIVCSGQSGNYNIVASSSGGNCTFKNLRAGTGISISSNSTHITITNSLPEQGCTSAGGTSIWKTTTTCDAKGLTAGVGLTLTSN